MTAAEGADDEVRDEGFSAKTFWGRCLIFVVSLVGIGCVAAVVVLYAPSLWPVTLWTILGLAVLAGVGVGLWRSRA